MQTGIFDGDALRRQAEAGSRSRPPASRGSPSTRPATRATGSATTGGGSGYTEYRAVPRPRRCAPGVSSGHRARPTSRSPRTARSGTRTSSRRRSGASSPATTPTPSTRLADIDPRSARARRGRSATAPDGTLWVAVTGGFSAPGANALAPDRPGRHAGGDGLQARRRAARRSRSRRAPNGDVWFAARPRRAAADRPARRPRPAAPTPRHRHADGDGVTPAAGTDTPAPPATGTVTDATRGHGQRPTHGDTTSDRHREGDQPDGARATAISANQICVGPPQDRCSLVYLIADARVRRRASRARRQLRPSRSSRRSARRT